MRKKIIFVMSLGTMLFSCFSGTSLNLKKQQSKIVPNDNVSSNLTTNQSGNDKANDAADAGTIEKAETTPTQPEKKKYWVVAVAGQSNSVGYDESYWDDSFRDTTGRVKQLGYYNEDNLKVIECMPSAQNIQNMSNLDDTDYKPKGGYGITGKGTKGIHLPLGQELLKYAPADYDVLIVPVAYGGTGFNAKINNGKQTYDTVKKRLKGDGLNANWNKDKPLYLTLRDRIKYALDMNPENKFLGVVWCQGEYDSDQYLDDLKTGFSGIVDQLGIDLASYTDQLASGRADKSLWYVHETTIYWRQELAGLKRCTEVFKFYKEFLGADHYISVPLDEKLTNKYNGGGMRTTPLLTSHFGNNAYRDVIAPKVADALKATLNLG